MAEVASVQTQQDFEIRVYDGDDNYVVVTFYELPDLPAIPPIPDTEVILGGGKAAVGNVATVIRDETGIFAPLTFDLQFRLNASKVWQLDAFGNPRHLTTWNVGSGPTVWTPVPVASIGTRRSARGVDIPCPGPKHVDQINGLFNIEAKDTASLDSGGSGEDFVHSLKGCVVNSISRPRALGDVFFTLSIACFGEIDLTQADFTVGTQTT